MYNSSLHKLKSAFCFPTKNLEILYFSLYLFAIKIEKKKYVSLTLSTQFFTASVLCARKLN